VLTVNKLNTTVQSIKLYYFVIIEQSWKNDSSFRDLKKNLGKRRCFFTQTLVV